ncbi:hypothetical protein O181_047190 [Austropuccinia psidii MF-1]|uniref:Chromo domain-containing protein n=1 Tax=Austropuccinia psidii MF-1 TaxID=1389203 RepID=A0A9Q3HMY1_9BASI|nr:hypothetical protein [Austropuccinia psidii MF-1]
MDASVYSLRTVLSQVYDSVKHPIALVSHFLLPAECNYEIHDQELFGIVWALKCWRVLLLSLPSPFKVLTDHSSLQYIIPSKILTFREAHWAAFHFSITYPPGRLANLLDALSRQDSVYPERGEDFISKNPIKYHQIVKKNEIQASKFFSVKVDFFSNFIDSMKKALWNNSLYRSILQDLGKDTPDGRLSTKIQQVLEDVRRELEVAINRFKRYADKRRESPPFFNPHDMKVRTHAYHIKIPSQWKSIHPVFHISLLEPVKTSTIPNTYQEPPPPIIIIKEEEWEVSKILDSKIKRGKLWYLVEWKGFSKEPERSTWERTENLKTCPELVKDFHSLYPGKPGCNSSRS